MAVKFTKPEINVREKLAELDKPSGIAGEAMLRAETPQEQFNLIGAGRRNLIINGDFKVSQRGTYTSTTTLTNTATYYLDRWKFYTFTNTSGTFQHKLDQTLPDDTVTNTHLHTSTSSDMNAPLVQLVEDHKAVWGKHFTVSFWYKSNKETYYNIWNGTSQIHFLVPSSGGAWKKWEQTYKLKENGAYFRLEFYSHTINMTSGSYLELAQVQIELGKVATPFEHRSYGEELALCQRYYQRIDGAGYSWITEVQRHNSTGFRSVLHLPVPLRVVPSISYSNLAYWYNNGSLSAGTQSLGVGYTATGRTDISHLNLEYIPTSMGLTTNGNLSAMLSFTSAGGYLAFSSEL